MVTNESSPDGTYLTYFPFGEVSLVPQIAAYHKKEKISCQSGANVVLTRESPDGTYYAYFPFGLSTEVPQ